jgi:hypothetical protein
MTARQVAKWTWIPVILVFAYSGWVLYNRRAENARIEESRQKAKAKADLEIVEKLGGERLKILMFYANPPVVGRGERGLLCYGVSNAKTVRIEPAVEGVGPTLSRCVEIHPKEQTTYTLIAADEKGREEKSTVEVRIRN